MAVHVEGGGGLIPANWNGDPEPSGTAAAEGREKLEIELLLEAIYRAYGYDFRNYAYDSIRRRIRHGMQTLGESSVSALIPRILHEPEQMRRLLQSLVINVTEMFRDPSMFKAFREKVVPFLHTYPHIRIWHAGCSTGEEVLSMAILLEEEGLYDKARIYATDIDERALEKARAGIYPLRNMKLYTQNYIRAGGTREFSDYYTADRDAVKFHSSLQRNVMYARHNLATDQSFNEFNVILCRNVLIYFDRKLQNRARRLFHESLAMFGVLALGSRETIRHNDYSECYEAIDDGEKLYRRMR
ncbi:CheR family methyltransferase [Cohnella thailandensis]|uniref:Protein-glutamate O-methyltransferase CheR n=1 Tax=Cohnella thailandensis TaxID=557557 RepID=A0A841SXE2_9BACL|nr:protein-glutamate O-methyltransferase CheR [Cohnella thailandensis]MBB6634287.1 protein-glutamate O-methyltransferase CheR [Cohnella thailandensis]MBP1972215.1 chemotaxis protein methyltransferase CheR [Cohnella thailandensis]